MKWRSLHIICIFICFIFCFGPKSYAQIPTRCFEISSILADACGNPEGENEMVRIQVGPSPLNTNNIKITWPNTVNPWRGFCTNQLKIDSLNQTIGGCGYLLAPPGGILPAGSQAIIVTSTSMSVSFNSFATLSDTIYILFQCAGNTNGHFVNYNATPGIRTLYITDTAAHCGDTVTYDRSLLTNITGGHGGGTAAENGASIAYTYNNVATYYNNGCNAPFQAPSVNAGSDTTVNFCHAPLTVPLHASKTGNFRHLFWSGGNGTFSQPDSLNTSYTFSPLDISPLTLYFSGTLCPDTLRDSVVVTVIPPAATTHADTICFGSSYTVNGHTYTATGLYHDTLTAVSGCDSLVNTDLTVLTAYTQVVNLTGCSSVLYRGTTYTASTAFQDTIRGVRGCDSVHAAVFLTVNYPSAYSQQVALCQGQTLTIGTTTHSTAGTYHDTIPNASGCDSVITTTLTYAPITVDAGSNTAICRGTSTTLQATGGLSYTWTPAGSLNSATIANPVATPDTTTTYTVTAQVASANEMVNGDFSSGNTGFSSSYLYTTNNTNEGQYTVSPNASTWNGGMAPCGDHTTGSGNMLIVNGATSANVSIYCQTVSTVPGTDYAFSTWLQSVTASNPAQLQFSINGALIGSVFSAQPANCNWQQFYTTWNSGTATSAQICIVNQNTIASGNDFALDDISFSPLCVQTDTVQVVVNPIYRDTVNVTVCAANTPYTLPDGATASTTGSYTSNLHTVNSCDSIVVVNLTVDTVILQTVTLPTACGQTTYNGTTYTSSTTVTENYHYQNGCDSLIKTVNVVVNPIATFSQSPTICLGQSFAAGSHSYTASGTYIDTVVGGSSLGCDSIVTTALTVVSPVSTNTTVSGTCSVSYLGNTYSNSTTLLDTVKSTATGCDSIYHTTTITVTPIAVSTVPNNVCINTGQTYYAGGQNQNTAGTYMDTIRSVGGCDSVIRVTDLQVITPTVVTRRTDSCSRATIGGITYTGDTILAFTQTSARGCDSIITMDSVYIHSPGTVSLSTSATLPIEEGDSTTITIIPSGSYHNIVWSPDSNISSVTALAPIVSPYHTTTYTVTLADSNNCSATASIEVTVLASSQLDFIMPTAFSPNGDGRNDIFKAILRRGAEITLFHIYNRWGELIYDINLNSGDGWDGTYKNIAQPIGVYVYYISVKSAGGNTTSQQGNLTLVR